MNGRVMKVDPEFYNMVNKIKKQTQKPHRLITKDLAKQLKVKKKGTFIEEVSF